MIDLVEMGKAARSASRRLALPTSARKDEALLAIAAELEAQAPTILAENALDIEDARANGLSESTIDRLLLTEARVATLASDVRDIARLPDPVGEELMSRRLPNGLRLSKRRIPIGVIGAIYEARPNVTIDIACLCLKTGNASILRGGSETLRSNLALVGVIHAALERTGMPQAAVQVIGDTDRRYVAELLRLGQYVDMIIPRGGAGLHRFCKENSTIPVITGGIGICHIYVDESADLSRALDIIENAKVQRPSVCNALDTLLIHHSVAERLLPPLAERLAGSGVELRVTPPVWRILEGNKGGARVTMAESGDFDREWLALILGIKLVANLDEAIAHIQTHSTEHSDSILTRNWEHAQRFVDEINSAAVYVNASTRFTDGGQFGLGAEVAVSTEKLHARGPMGLEELTTYKWIGFGDGHVRT
jgi:glutamate-5-semialdehyde dehydrogenase